MLVVFGDITLDAVFPVPHIALAGDRVFSGTGWVEPGGHGANQAIAAARDGARVELVGAVGEDDLAATVLAALKADGVHTSRIARVEGATGRSAISVTADGHTTVVTDSGVNLLARAELVPDHRLRPGGTLLVQLGTELGEVGTLMRRARARGSRVVLHVSPARALDTEAMRAADLIIANAEDLAWLGQHLGTGNNPASIRAALGVDTVRMLGVQGAEAAWTEGFLSVPAMPVRMRDTTAAADGYVGVLTAALHRGASLPEAMRRAGVAAALATTHPGTRRSMPMAAAIDAKLADAPLASAVEPEVTD